MSTHPKRGLPLVVLGSTLSMGIFFLSCSKSDRRTRVLLEQDETAEVYFFVDVDRLTSEGVALSACRDYVNEVLDYVAGQIIGAALEPWTGKLPQELPPKRPDWATRAFPRGIEFEAVKKGKDGTSEVIRDVLPIDLDHSAQPR